MAIYTKQQEFVLSENGGGIVPNATVTVYLFPTLTKASLFTDATASTPMSNPIQADSTGFYWFYADNSLHYTLMFTGFGMTPRTLTDVLIPGGGGGTSGVGPAGPPGPPGQAIVSWGIVPVTHDAAGIQEAIYDAFDAGQQGIGMPMVILEPGVIYDMGNTQVNVQSRTGTGLQTVDLNSIVPAHFAVGNNSTTGFKIWCPGMCMWDLTQQDNTHPAIEFNSALNRAMSSIENIAFRGSVANSWATKTSGMVYIKNCTYHQLNIGHQWAAQDAGLYTEQSILSDCEFVGCQSPIQYKNYGTHQQASFRGTGLMGKNIWSNPNTNTNAFITIIGNTIVYMSPLDIDVSASSSSGRAYLIDNAGGSTACNFYGNIHCEMGLLQPLIIGKPAGQPGAIAGSGTEFFFSGNLGANRGFLRLGSCRLARHVYTFGNFFHSALHEEKTIDDQGSLNGIGQMRVAVSGTSMVHVQIKTGNYDCRYMLNVAHMNNLISGPNGELSPNNNNGTVTVEAVEVEMDDGGYGTFLTGHTTFAVDADGGAHGGFVSLLITNTNLINRGTRCWVTVIQQSENDRDISYTSVSPQPGQGIDFNHTTGWSLQDPSGSPVVSWVDATHFQVSFTNASGPTLGSRQVNEFYPGRVVIVYDAPAGVPRGRNATLQSSFSDPVAGVTRILETDVTLDSSLYHVAVPGD